MLEFFNMTYGLIHNTMISKKCNDIFNKAIIDYHYYNSIQHPINNPYAIGIFEHLLYDKSWIDTVQWHLEDQIRSQVITLSEVVRLKRSIDKSNQERTDIVECIDSFFYSKYKNVKPSSRAGINTESPAWAIDRLSILALKIYHMNEQVGRTDIDQSHIIACNEKLMILRQQNTDLSIAIDELICDIENGNKFMKVYRQMKMYNDPTLNPVLYNKITI